MKISQLKVETNNLLKTLHFSETQLFLLISISIVGKWVKEYTLEKMSSYLIIFIWSNECLVTNAHHDSYY